MDVFSIFATIEFDDSEFQTGIQNAQTSINNITSELDNQIPILLAQGSQIGTGIVDAIAEGITDALPKLVTVAESITTKLGDSISKNKDTFIFTGVKLAEALNYGFKSGGPESMGRAINNFLSFGVEKTIGGAFSEAGKSLGNELANGLSTVLSPKGMVIAGVVALTGALVALTRETNRETDAQRKSRLERERMVTTTNNLIDDARRSADAHAERVRAFENEASVISHLMERFHVLYNLGTRETDQRAEMVKIVNLLNDSVEGLNLTYCAITDSLNQTYDATRRQTDAWKEQESIIAEERQTELYRQRLGLISDIEEAMKDLYYREKTNIVAHGFWGEAINSNQQYINDVIARINHLNAELADNEYAYASNSAIVETSIDAKIAAAEAYANSTEAQMARVAAATQKLVYENKSQFDDLIASYENVKTSARQMFSAMSNETEMTLRDVRGNLETNIDVTRQWGLDIAALGDATGLDLYEGFLDYITNMSVDSADKVRMFAQALEDDPAGLQYISDLFKEAGATSMEAITNAFGDDLLVIREVEKMARNAGSTLEAELKAAGFDAMGANIVYSFIDAIKARQDLILQTTRDSARFAADGMRQGLQIGSPSRLFKRFAGWTVDGYVNEIYKRKGEAAGAIAKMTDDIKKAGADVEIPLADKKQSMAPTKTMLDEKTSIFSDSYAKIAKVVQDGLTNTSRKSQDITRRMTRDIEQFFSIEGFAAGRTLAQALGQGLMSEQSALLRQAMSMAAQIKAAFSSSGVGGFQPVGSFATGLNFVPYDNFPALLHRGEMVLTAQQATDYREGDSGGDTIIQNFYGVTERETGYSAYRGFQKAQLALGRG